MLTSVQNVREYLSYDDTDVTFDNFVTRCIEVGSQLIKKYVNQNIESEENTDTFMFDKDTENYIFMKSPVISVNSLSYQIDAFDSAKLISSDEYKMIKKDGIANLFLQNNFKENYIYTVTYNSGFVSVPKDIEQVCIEMVARMVTESAVGGSFQLGLTTKSLNLEKFAQNEVFVESLEPRWFRILKRYRVYNV